MGEKGDVIPVEKGGYCTQFCQKSVSEAEYHNYPMLFKEVEVKADEEVFRDYLIQFDLGNIGQIFTILSKALLSKNAINPEFIKTLREKC